MKNKLSFGSLCVHDEKPSVTTQPHQLPLYASSSFEFESVQQGIDIFTGQQDGHIYARFGNPTVDTVANKLAKLESFGLDMEAHCLLTSSVSHSSVYCYRDLFSRNLSKFSFIFTSKYVKV